MISRSSLVALPISGPWVWQRSRQKTPRLAMLAGVMVTRILMEYIALSYAAFALHCLNKPSWRSISRMRRSSVCRWMGCFAANADMLPKNCKVFRVCETRWNSVSFLPSPSLPKSEQAFLATHEWYEIQSCHTSNINSYSVCRSSYQDHSHRPCEGTLGERTLGIPPQWNYK